MNRSRSDGGRICATTKVGRRGNGIEGANAIAPDKTLIISHVDAGLPFVSPSRHRLGLRNAPDAPTREKFMRLAETLEAGRAK